MDKVASIDQRKADHININLEQDVRSGIRSGLERYRFTHEALPELDLSAVNLSTSIFGVPLHLPLLISSMTGGVAEAERINRNLAQAAQECRIAMGVGSQRAALEDPGKNKSFIVAREIAPDIPLFANLGAVQLNNGYTIAHCQRAVDMIQANALILHLNPLQEAVQAGGDTNFKSLAKKIASVCKALSVPVIVKEVGWGISERTARILSDCGVAAIDVAGAGGTSWSQVEMHRAPDEHHRELAAAFVEWGIGTADSILQVRRASQGMQIFASGGLRNGLDIAKAIALGASLGGLAGPFLKAAAVSAEKAVELVRLIEAQLSVTMFSSGAADLSALSVHEIS
jgi:isopentenyl-diphosphate delta-isomerase